MRLHRCCFTGHRPQKLRRTEKEIKADLESAIQQAMTELCRDKTIIVIAHRLNTIANADKVVVLDEGLVVETGSLPSCWQLAACTRAWR